MQPSGFVVILLIDRESRDMFSRFLVPVRYKESAHLQWILFPIQNVLRTHGTVGAPMEMHLLKNILPRQVALELRRRTKIAAELN